jgi:hypothetical protein
MIKKIHTYLGLLNLSFLVIFGLTGAHLALHRPAENDLTEQPVRFEDFTPPTSVMDDRDLGELIRRRLNIAAVSWDPHRDRDNDLVVDYYTHKGPWRVTALEKEHRLRIAKLRENGWGFINNLHATENRDVADWRVRLWTWYNEFALWSLMAMALTGLYLWLSSRPKFRLAQLAVAAGSGAFVLLYWFSR